MTHPRNSKRLLCHCLTVTWQEVEDTVREHGCRTVQQVTRHCGAGGGCKSCHVEIEEVIKEVRAQRVGTLRRLLGGLFSRNRGS